MIDEKKIEEAAEESTNYLKGIVKFPVINASKEGFKTGIEWFKENLWHNANEKPKEDVCIIVQSKLGKEYYTSVYSNGEFKCDGFCLLYKEIIRWFYINDLMKEGK